MTQETASQPINSNRLEDLTSYRPLIEDNQWVLSATDVDFISIGSFVLGCGGGGDPGDECQKIKELLLQTPGSVRVVGIHDLNDSMKIGCTANMGRPEVSTNPKEDTEPLLAQLELMKHMSLDKVDAMIAVEVGGANGLMSFRVAADLKVPVVDGDYMGRAYPTCYQVTSNVDDVNRKGENLLPAAIATANGTSMILPSCNSDKMIDGILRAVYLELGTPRAGFAARPQSGDAVKTQAVPNTLSMAWRIGRAIKTKQDAHGLADTIIDEVGGRECARKLFEGKITNVERNWEKGHMYGLAEIRGHDEKDQTVCRIPFKNENIAVQLQRSQDEKVETLVSVPDLIAVLDRHTGRGLGAMFEYSVGMEVVVIAVAVSPRWTKSPRGLELGGPAAMGYEDIIYKSVGKYKMPRSVIEEFTKPV